MTITTEVRTQVRKKYNYCCAFCGVSENSVGGELEVEHFQPKTRGGTDNIDNLLYVCTTCNRFKSNYWPVPHASIHLHLLHPEKDRLTDHIQELDDGQLIGLTERGWFHIEWLHLNRPQLVMFRQLRLQKQLADKLLKESEAVTATLQDRVSQLEAEIVRLRAIIQQFIAE